MKRIALCALLLLMTVTAALADTTIIDYRSESLCYTVEKFKWGGAVCYVSRIDMASPGEQIGKSSAEFAVSLELPSRLAKNAERTVALAVNGSGFISKSFPTIPDEYPGESKDYYNQPWGALTVIHGETRRKLDGLLFTGLTLQEDGLHLHSVEPVEDVLAQNPKETWSFYDYAVVILDGEKKIDPDLKFNAATHTRNILCKTEDGEYLIVTVTDKGERYGLTMVEAADMILELFTPEWAFNLDGNGSYALLARKTPGAALNTIVGDRTRVTDIMYFSELP